jgi:hypothetical protein
MTAGPVAPVIPAASRGRLRPGRLGAGRPMPLASPPGRLCWRCGDRLTLTADAGVLIARHDPGGLVTVPARPYIVIPASLRRRWVLWLRRAHLWRARPPGLQSPCRSASG